MNNNDAMENLIDSITTAKNKLCVTCHGDWASVDDLCQECYSKAVNTEIENMWEQHELEQLGYTEEEIKAIDKLIIGTVKDPQPVEDFKLVTVELVKEPIEPLAKFKETAIAVRAKEIIKPQYHEHDADEEFFKEFKDKAFCKLRLNDWGDKTVKIQYLPFGMNPESNTVWRDLGNVYNMTYWAGWYFGPTYGIHATRVIYVHPITMEVSYQMLTNEFQAIAPTHVVFNDRRY